MHCYSVERVIPVQVGPHCLYTWKMSSIAGSIVTHLVPFFSVSTTVRLWDCPRQMACPASTSVTAVFHSTGSPKDEEIHDSFNGYPGAECATVTFPEGTLKVTVVT